jgi:hypothetical protein
LWEWNDGQVVTLDETSLSAVLDWFFCPGHNEDEGGSHVHCPCSSFSWKEYSRLLRVFAERPAVRLPYDREVLEIMSPRSEHEMPVDMLGRFVMILTEELQLATVCGGSSTLRRRRRQRGIEPDKCWWIANAAASRSICFHISGFHPHLLPGIRNR